LAEGNFYVLNRNQYIFLTEILVIRERVNLTVSANSSLFYYFLTYPLHLPIYFVTLFPRTMKNDNPPSPPFSKLNVSHKSAAGHKEGGITGAIEALA